jgi:hypothetical protein
MGTTMMKMDGRLRLVIVSQLYIHNWQSGRRCQVTHLHTDRGCLMHDNTRKAYMQSKVKAAYEGHGRIVQIKLQS